MKKVIYSLLLIPTFLYAESNCNHSQLTLTNSTTEPLKVFAIESQVPYPSKNFGYFFGNAFGKFENEKYGQIIPANESLTITAIATNGSSGDIYRNIKLMGSKGLIDIDVTFQTYLWGYGTCNPHVDVISTNYQFSSSTQSGIPASARVEIK